MLNAAVFGPTPIARQTTAASVQLG